MKISNDLTWEERDVELKAKRERAKANTKAPKRNPVVNTGCGGIELRGGGPAPGYWI